jgi:hypothetical protein
MIRIENYIFKTAEKEVPPDYIGVGGPGVSPSFNKSPKTGGIRGLVETISAVSLYIGSTVS